MESLEFAQFKKKHLNRILVWFPRTFRVRIFKIEAVTRVRIKIFLKSVRMSITVMTQVRTLGMMIVELKRRKRNER